MLIKSKHYKSVRCIFDSISHLSVAVECREAEDLPIKIT